MKIRNFKRAFNHVLLNVQEDSFDMMYYRKETKGSSIFGNFIDDKVTQECGSVGCIIGHCSILDTPENFYSFNYFSDWSEYFFGIEEGTTLWDFCFSGDWGADTKTNNKTQSLLRLQYVIENEDYPDDYYDEDYNFVMPKKELKPYIL